MGKLPNSNIQGSKEKSLMSNPPVCVHIKAGQWRTHCEIHLPQAPPCTVLTLEAALVHLPDPSSPKL